MKQRRYEDGTLPARRGDCSAATTVINSTARAQSCKTKARGRRKVSTTRKIKAKHSVGRSFGVIVGTKILSLTRDVGATFNVVLRSNLVSTAIAPRLAPQPQRAS